MQRKNVTLPVICRDYLTKFVKPTDTVFDIACGYGEFLNNIHRARKIAIDLNLDAVKYRKPGTAFQQCAATEVSTVVNGVADVVFTSNFLEHLPDKKTLDVFLEQVHAVLKPGGRYIILGPNLRYLPGAYWDFYDHHLGLTHVALTEALQLKGFKIETCIDRFLPYTTQGALPTHPKLVEIYLKLQLAWKFFGKQFLIVVQKPA